MIFDALNLFSDDQDLSQTAATYLCDKSIDLGASATDSLGNTVISDIGRGQAEVIVQVTEAFVGVGATVKAELVMADDEALTSNLVVLQSTAAIGVATLVPGYQWRLAIPVGISKRYLGVQYVIATATTTAGKATAGIVTAKQTNPVV